MRELKHVCIYIYIYIYIYICVCVCVCVYAMIHYIHNDGCPLDFDHGHLLCLMSSNPALYSTSPTPPSLNSMSSEVILQASQAATEFTSELTQPFSLACSDIIWVPDRFGTFTQMAFETSKR